MSEAEYLAYDRAHGGTYEYVDGEVVARSSGSAAHDRIQINTVVALRYRLLDASPRAVSRTRARAHGAGQRIHLAETGIYAYPDAAIVWDEPVYASADREAVVNPTVLVEVFSEASEIYDRGAKAVRYRRGASVELILLIDSRRRRVERSQRNADATWTWSEHTSGAISVLELELPLEELYEGVVLATESSRSST